MVQSLKVKQEKMFSITNTFVILHRVGNNVRAFCLCDELLMNIGYMLSTKNTDKNEKNLYEEDYTLYYNHCCWPGKVFVAAE